MWPPAPFARMLTMGMIPAAALVGSPAVERGKETTAPADRDRPVLVAMIEQSPAQAEIERRRGWMATGAVIDEFGRPVADAEVRVATGRGTLLGGGSTRTGPDGRFTLRFDEGVWSNDPVNAQAAIFSVAKDGFIERSRSRPGHHMMARKMPAADDLEVEPDRIILEGRPYSIDFVLAGAAAVEVELEGPDDPPIVVTGPGEGGGRRIAQQEGPSRWTLVPGRPWRFQQPVRKSAGLTTRSLPFTLPRPGRYRIKLRSGPHRPTGVRLLEILSVKGPVGDREIRDKVIGDDPMARPPVPEDLQRRGRDLLRRMAEASRPWLGPVSGAVKSYEYRFRLEGQDDQTFRVGEGPASDSIRRGISYASPIHHLATHPEAAAFRQVEVGPDRIALAYTLMPPSRIAAGNGVQNTWHGFFGTPFRDGVLVLDARRLTPQENRSYTTLETFSEYVEVEPGRFAPLAIRLEQGEDDEHRMRFDWTFQVIEPGLWLFAAGEYRGKLVATLDRIRVNGTEAKIIARGRGRGDGPD